MIYPAYSSINGRSIIKLFILFGFVIVLCTAAYVISSSCPHEIIIDGTVVAKTASLGEARQSVNQAKTLIAGKQLPENIRLPQQISFRRISDPGDVVSVEEAAEIVSKNISAESLLYTITSDGKPVAALSSKNDAEAVVGKLKTYYDNQLGDIKGESEFKEKVRIKRQFAPLQVAYASIDDAVEFLTSYIQQPRTHIVAEGERAVNIADKYNIPVSDIMRYNPEVDITMLEPNQSLIIKPGIKPVTVVTKAFVTMTTQLKPPSDVYRRNTKITGKRVTKMMTVYENGLPVQSEIVSQVTTWNRPKFNRYRRRHKSDQVAAKLAGIASTGSTASSSSALEHKTP